MRNRIVFAIVATLVLAAVLVGIDLLVLAANNPNSVIKRPHYYMALGDSLTFGYQPNLNLTDGFADKVYQDLHSANVSEEINYACAGESTTTMIQGGCIARYAHHGAYTGSQLDAAVSFLKAHPGQVSPITLEIGANDILTDWLGSVCQPSQNAAADLATMDSNLTKTILPELDQALGGAGGFRAGDLVMLNYYNPFAQECPSSATFVHTFNQHLAADAAQFGVPIVDTYSAFGGDANMANNICQGPVDSSGVHHPYTWMCIQPYMDLHPTTEGYSVMAVAVEQTLGYPTGSSMTAAGLSARVPLPAAYRAPYSL
jgi:lysophospholipase L1-like esterase